MADEMMLIPKADLVAGYDAIRAKGVPGLIKSGELAGKIASIQGGAPNGTKWEKTNVSEAKNSVCYLNNLALAAGTNGIDYSEDGKTWVKSNVTTGVMQSIACGNGFAVGTRQEDDGVWSSDDGKTWTFASIPGDRFVGAKFCGGLFFVSSLRAGTFYSEDGKTWAKCSGLTRLARDFIWYKGVFAAACSNGAWYSLDGRVWAQSSVTTRCDKLATLNQWLLLSGTDDVGDQYIFRSVDGKTWEPSPSVSVYAFSDGTQVNEKAIVIYQTTLAESLDGLEWNKVVGAPTSLSYAGICFADRVLVIGTNTPGNLVLYSVDGGATFNQLPVAVGNVYQIVHGNGMWIMAASTGVWYSPTWEPS